MEECLEVSQVISKILRFGEFSKNPNDINSNDNFTQLNNEIGDLLAMVEVIKENTNLIDEQIIKESIQKKKKKLEQWMTGGKGWQEAVNIHKKIKELKHET